MLFKYFLSSFVFKKNLLAYWKELLLYNNRTISYCSVRKQVVNVPSYVVRLDSQKYIDLAHDSALAGGRPGT